MAAVTSNGGGASGEALVGGTEVPGHRAVIDVAAGKSLGVQQVPEQIVAHLPVDPLAGEAGQVPVFADEIMSEASGHRGVRRPCANVDAGKRYAPRGTAPVAAEGREDDKVVTVDDALQCVAII